MKHIVLTGGGTAGHVTPNIALHIVRRNDSVPVVPPSETRFLRYSHET